MRKLKLFRRVFLQSRWFREQFSPAGLVVVSLAVFAGAFGLDTQSNLAHLVFSLCAGLLVVDLVAARWLARRAPRVSARRFLPEFVTVGEPARYRIEVTRQRGGAGRNAWEGLKLVERLRQPWPSSEALGTYPDNEGGGHEGGEGGRRNRFDRRVGYPAFINMLRRLRAVDILPVALPPLWPEQAVFVDVPMAPLARGLAVFEEMAVIVAGPLGLAEVRLPVITGEDALPVLPVRRPIDMPMANSHRHLQPGGVSLMQRVGDSEEFRSLRDYRPGDPLRSVHWRSFARTGKPMVREYQEEFFTRHALALDTAAVHAMAPEFETAVSVAAWLVARPHDADSLLDLLFVGDRVHTLTTGRGLGEPSTMLKVLATVAPAPPEQLDALFDTLLHRAGQMASVIVILLCWDDRRREAMRKLLASGTQLTIILVDPPAENSAHGANAPGAVKAQGAASITANTSGIDVDGDAEGEFSGLLHHVSVRSPRSGGAA